ncbi:MAG: SpoIIE family protein phosphatase [Leptospiraceae bacterium]|nr:SpoIIE family protein phosphatase [Leptospiraceae bacterium]MCP5497519.1 SpoIIE family protein phosphatase [Leptospiraceae bacterium]
MCIFFLVFFPISLFSQAKISLTENCQDFSEKTDCKPREWFVINNFSSNYTSIKKPDENWKKIIKFPIAPGIIFPSEKSLETYTLFVKFDLEDIFLTGNNQPGIRLSCIGMVYEIFINGHFIGGEGKTKNGKLVYSRTVRNVIWEINPNFLREKDNVLVIKLQGHPKNLGTGLYFIQGYEIGFYQNLKYEVQDRIGLILGTLYLLMGLYHIFLFSKRKKEVYNLYFGMYTINTFLYLYTRTNEVFELPIDTDYITRTEFGVLYTLVPLFMAFIDSLLFNKLSKATLYYSGFCGMLILINLVFPFYLLEVPILRIWQLSAFIVLPYIFSQLFKSIKSKNQDAARLFAGTILLISSAIFDILDSMTFHTGLAFTKFTLFTLILGIAAILANRFLNLYETVEDLNTNLEKRVEKRTKELKHSLHEIRFLKEHQDGDYFLTTLIVKPLAFNNVKSETVKVDFILKQKKKFEFKKREHEIGGDLCVADSIQLHWKKYTVFINGDAMGKSIQGAGGSIVLGVVFKSILSRTKLFSINQNLFPEQWLKVSFIELQNIFEAFEGSMMISIVIGLIDEDNGMMYFINAEHPWVVLYRDKIASFLEEELTLHKIGISELKKKIIVQTFPLKNQDIIFIGSDGKDDIVLQIKEDGKKVINEDETLFLKMVERGNGDLIPILQNIENTGELTDDLSLLKIEYHNNHQQIYDQSSVHFQNGVNLFGKGEYESAIGEFEKAFRENPEPRIFKYLGRIHYKLQNYQNAADYYVLYIEQEPWSERDIYRASECFKAIGDWAKAEACGSRLKLRNPGENRYLLNLIDIYIQTNKIEKANKLIKRILEVDPQNSLALTFRDMLKNKV